MSSNRLPILIGEIEREHLAATRDAISAWEHAIACGRLLLEAKAALPHGEWLPWLEANVSFGARQAQKYMRLAEAGLDLNAHSSSHFTINGAMALLAEPRANEHAREILCSSESVEYYTAPHIVARVVEVMGDIDLDPSWHSDSPVRARTTYTAADDGLTKIWFGRVYLNPPYGREIDPWVEKLVADYEQGAITEAIALVPANVGAQWFQRFDAYPRCFIWGRLKFANADSTPTFWSAVIYLGQNVARFAAAFSEIGGIWVRLGAAP